MANWEYVMPYTQAFAVWLEEHGYPHPPVREGNRLPTTGEVCASLRRVVEAGCFDEPTGDRLYVGSVGEPGWTLCLDGFDWGDEAGAPAESFRMRGTLEHEAALLIDLSRSCGQLLAYPDSGEIPLILDAQDDPAEVCTAYGAAQQEADPWRHFFAARFGDRTGDA